MREMLSDYLYRKASVNKIPLAGTFELSPVCNFACKMCYVRKTREQIGREGKRFLDWKEWEALGKTCRDAGMLYLLITGGEPFIYPNFKELYLSLHKMGLVISINSNGTMIDEETVEWLKEAAPSRINITLYGGSKETYGRICGNEEGFERAVNAILRLKKAGIPVIINASMIPENADDLEFIIQFGKEHNILTRISTYMFPPIRREREESDSRLSAEQSAELYMRKVQCQMEPENLRTFLKEQLNELKKQEEMTSDGDWGSHPDEYMRCRAGRSAFWISWEGIMTACGITSFPKKVYPLENAFEECWMELTNAVRTTTVLKECVGCKYKETCRPCVAMLDAEVGNVNRRAPYLCEMTERVTEKIEKKIKELEVLADEE